MKTKHALTLLSAAIIACSSAQYETPPTPVIPPTPVVPPTPQPLQTGTAQMNDVSILLPLATTQNDFNAYLSASAQGVGGPMVPLGIFTPFDVPGMTAVGPGQPELVYSTLRMVAIRLDPCFAQIGPITSSTTCLNQLRVIFQSLSCRRGDDRRRQRATRLLLAHA